ncbi:hypothetical protein LTR86_010139 [Recurvomyces mirabilis]|nr:hypothetical protein LTR86_010139 [Recurvomyces mirabilis]
MHFSSTLFTLPCLALAVPQPATFNSTTDITTYHYTFPEDFQHPGVPSTVNFTQAQVNYLTSRSNISISSDGAIVLPVDEHLIIYDGDTDSSVSAQAGIKELVADASWKCKLCLAACAAVSITGPEDVIICCKYPFPAAMINQIKWSADLDGSNILHC